MVFGCGWGAEFRKLSGRDAASVWQVEAGSPAAAARPWLQDRRGVAPGGVWILVRLEPNRCERSATRWPTPETQLVQAARMDRLETE